MRVVTYRLPRCGVAVLTTGAAALLALLLSPLSLRVPFALFAAAVVVSSLEGGLKPGLWATALSTIVLGVYCWLLPLAQLPGSQDEVVPLMILFVIVGLVSSYLGDCCWKAVQAVDAKAVNARKRREERFRALAACAPTGIMQMDPQSRCVYANCSCQLLGGFAAHEGLGDGWTRFVHADDRDRVVAAWTRAMQAGKEFACEFRFQTPEPDGRWVRLRSSPMYSEVGKVLGHVAVLQDIADQRFAEEALEETRMLLGAIAQETADPLLVMNLEGRYLLTNPAAARMMGNPGCHGQYVVRNKPLRDGRGNIVGLINICRENRDNNQPNEAQERPLTCQEAKGGNTELARTVSLLQDETLARQQAEAKLRATEARLRTGEAYLADLVQTNTMLQEIVRARDRALDELRHERELLENRRHGSGNGSLRNGKSCALEVT